jgi:NTE family protein
VSSGAETSTAPAIARNPEVGLVLGGGGARGAYEAGALATLLPRLEERGELPGIVLGTSIGALNGSHVAATAHLSAAESAQSLLELWREVRFSDAIAPLVSPRELGRLLVYVGGILGVPKARVPAVLDTTRLADEIRALVDLRQVHTNVDDGLISLAVVATSYAAGDSVVFHDGPRGAVVQADARRGIRYVPTGSTSRTSTPPPRSRSRSRAPRSRRPRRSPAGTATAAPASTRPSSPRCDSAPSASW